MLRCSVLTVEEKSKIDAYKNCSVWIGDIGSRINRSDAVIRNYFKIGKNYGKRKPTNGNQKIIKRSIGKIKKEATKNRLSVSQIVSKLSLPGVCNKFYIAQKTLNTENL